MTLGSRGVFDALQYQSGAHSLTLLTPFGHPLVLGENVNNRQRFFEMVFCARLELLARAGVFIVNLAPI